MVSGADSLDQSERANPHMAKSSSEQGPPATPPFLVKTYDLVSDEATDAIVSWGESNSSFVVWRPDDFARELLPRYFKHNKFPSFIRQLNTYGFKKLNPESWEFAHKDSMFVRHRPDLLASIRPRNSPKAMIVTGSSPRSSMPGTEMCPLGSVSAEVDALKRDKIMLTKELIRLAQLLDGSGSELRRLRANLEATEARQHQMMTFLNRIVRNPAILQRYLAFPSDDAPTGCKRRRMGASEGTEDERTPASLDNISLMEPFQSNGGTAAGAGNGSCWEQAQHAGTSTPRLFTEAPVDPRSLEEAFTARGPPLTAYSTVRVLEVPRNGSLTAEQPAGHDNAASNPVHPKQQEPDGESPPISSAAQGDYDPPTGWQQKVQRASAEDMPSSPAACFNTSPAEEALSADLDNSLAGRVCALPSDVSPLGGFGYLYGDLPPGMFTPSGPPMTAAGGCPIPCSATAIEPVYGKLAATKPLAAEGAPAGGMELDLGSNAVLNSSSAAADSAPEEAMERSSSLTTFNDIMHACMQLTPDEMLQIPPLSVPPDMQRV